MVTVKKLDGLEDQASGVRAVACVAHIDRIAPPTGADKLRNFMYTSIHLADQPTVTIKMCPTGTRVAITSNLDVYGGQSGSAIWSSDGNIRAVHSASGGGKAFHAPIDKDAYTFIAKYRK